MERPSTRKLPEETVKISPKRKKSLENQGFSSDIEAAKKINYIFF